MTCSGLSPRNKVAYLVDPIGNKDIRFALDLALSVRREDQVRSIGGEHGKAIEGFVERDPLETGSVLVDDEEIEVSALGIMPVRTEDDPLPVGMPERTEARTTQVGHLPQIAPVSIHREDLE